MQTFIIFLSICKHIKHINITNDNLLHLFYILFLSADPDPPMRLTKGDVVKGKTYVVIKWARPSGGVDRYNITVNCNCSCTPNYTDSVIKTEVNVTELKPGTHCSILIKTISLGLPSTPLEYLNIETTETGNEKCETNLILNEVT